MIENPVVRNDLELFASKTPFVQELRGKSFLVTGGTGLIGSTFIKCMMTLNEKYDTNIRVIGMARTPQKVEQVFGDAKLEWVYQDMTAPLLLQETDIDYIIHCANSTSSKFYVECPVENINTAYLGTNQLLDYAQKSHVKSMVYLSSLECYGSIHDEHEIKEDMMGYITPTDVRSSYSLGKRASECLCHCYAKEYGIPVKMARLTQTFGAGVSMEDNRVFAQFTKSIIKGENIELHTEGRSAKPYCYTIDAINAILYLLFKGVDGEAYNVANSDSYISIRDMAQFLIDNFNGDCKLVIHQKEGMGYAPETQLRLNTDKLQSLGWNPYYNLKDMYRSLIEYYKTKL